MAKVCYMVLEENASHIGRGIIDIDIEDIDIEDTYTKQNFDMLDIS